MRFATRFAATLALVGQFVMFVSPAGAVAKATARAAARPELAALARAKALYGEGRYDEALQTLSAMLASPALKDPARAAGLAMLARCYVQKGNLARARQGFDDALTLVPDLALDESSLPREEAAVLHEVRAARRAPARETPAPQIATPQGSAPATPPAPGGAAKSPPAGEPAQIAAPPVAPPPAAAAAPQAAPPPARPALPGPAVKAAQGAPAGADRGGSWFSNHKLLAAALGLGAGGAIIAATSSSGGTGGGTPPPPPSMGPFPGTPAHN